MKALFIPHFAKEKALASLILFTLMFWVYPHNSLAFSLQSEGQNTAALVFEIKNLAQTKTQSSLTIQNTQPNSPLAQLVQQYLEDHGSPLAPYANQIVTYDNWKKALAISFVESNMCIHQIDNNCSGMGGAPGSPTWRKYSTQLDWFADLNTLLDKPLYTDKCNTFKKMMGCYVQPGSPAWLYGTQKVYAELSNLEDQATAMKASQKSPLALATIPNGSVVVK